MARGRTQRERVNGYELSYEAVGEGEPQLVLHWGILGDRRQFLPLAVALDGYGTRTVLDGRPYGESDAPRAPYTLEDYAEDLAVFVRSVAGGPAVLIGHSVGAMTFLHVALSHPELVAAMVLADTSAAPEDPDDAAGYEALLHPLLEEGPTEELLDTVAGARLMSPSFIERHPDEIAGWREAMRHLDVAAFEAHTRAVLDRGDLRGELARITAPTLVIVGSDDAVTPPDRAEELTDGLGGPSTLAVINGAGHFAPWEQPAETLAAVRPFLDELGLRPPA